MIVAKFRYLDQDWRVEEVYKGMYRIIDVYGSWFLLEVTSKTKAIAEAKIKIKRIGKYNLKALKWSSGGTFEVIAERLTFRTGSHIRNLSGDADKHVYKGDTLVHRADGDNGFFYLKNDKSKEDLKGSLMWSLIYDEKIKLVSHIWLEHEERMKKTKTK